MNSSSGFSSDTQSPIDSSNLIFSYDCEKDSLEDPSSEIEIRIYSFLYEKEIKMKSGFDKYYDFLDYERHKSDSRKLSLVPSESLKENKGFGKSSLDLKKNKLYQKRINSDNNIINLK